ncbi:hypothetical protein GOY17_07315 [Lysobacter soli]|uniref:PAAR domain-containing protein n=1 Tax=Lysobacter soli TaxID=453783 RepID=UPI0012EEC704|nr:PAAR domain-containing protein [Lysobacter soli]QGW64742.1 hypothetical protein GOY17_07315 [Lysobacter soli]
MNEARQTIKATYAVATDGATTERGGEVVARKSASLLDGRDVARVGDEVRYPDGRKAWIITGSRYVILSGRPIAVVGSRLNNGDVISASPSTGAALVEFEGMQPVLAEYPVPA